MKAKICGAVAAILVFGGCGRLDAFLYTPKRTDAYEFKAEGESASDTVTADRIEPLTVESEEGVTLGAVFVRGSVQPPVGTILFFHGKGDHLDGNFWRIKSMANWGYDVYAVDYRGFGVSTQVAPTEAGIEADTAAFLALVQQRTGLTGEFVYYGHSLGASVATQRAVTNPPQVLILEASFASIQEFVRDSTAVDLPSPFVMRDTWKTADRISLVHAPVLFLHGTKDDFVRAEFSELLFERANEPKRLELVEGAEHNVADYLGDQWQPLVDGFIQEHLP
jgi:uncharacterized protein